MQISLSIDALDKVRRGLKEAPEMVEKELRSAMAECTLLLERETTIAFPRSKEQPTHPDAKLTPKRSPGLTAQSIYSDYFSTPTGILGVVASSSPIATFVELGTRPHTIRPKDAQALAFPLGVTPVASPLGVNGAFKVARSVNHPGTKPNPVFAKTLEKNAGKIVQRFEDAADAIARNLLG